MLTGYQLLLSYTEQIQILGKVIHVVEILFKRLVAARRPVTSTPALASEWCRWLIMGIYKHLLERPHVINVVHRRDLLLIWNHRFDSQSGFLGNAVEFQGLDWALDNHVGSPLIAQDWFMALMNVVVALHMSGFAWVYHLVIRKVNVGEIVTRLRATLGVSRLLFHNLDVIFAHEARAIIFLVIYRIRGDLRLEQNATVGFLERQTLFRMILDYGRHPWLL